MCISGIKYGRFEIYIYIYFVVHTLCSKIFTKLANLQLTQIITNLPLLFPPCHVSNIYNVYKIFIIHNSYYRKLILNKRLKCENKEARNLKQKQLETKIGRQEMHISEAHIGIYMKYCLSLERSICRHRQKVTQGEN